VEGAAALAVRLSKLLTRIWREGSARRVPGWHSRIPHLLISEAASLRSVARRFDQRLSDRYVAALWTLDHVRASTGAPHSGDVALILDLTAGTLRGYESKLRTGTGGVVPIPVAPTEGEITALLAFRPADDADKADGRAR
jgi:hypothetical protein